MMAERLRSVTAAAVFFSTLSTVGLGYNQQSDPSSEAEPAQESVSPAMIHVNHVARAINGTPDGVGLLQAAEMEAEVASSHAALAASDPTNLEGMQNHVRHVRHAVDPTKEAKGPGKGYGLERAAKGASTHILLATRSSGVHDAIKTHAPHISASASNAAGWAGEILTESDKVLAAETAEAAAPAVQRIVELTQWIADGVDADGDGKTSWMTGEGGLAQASQHLSLLVSALGQGSSN